GALLDSWGHRLHVGANGLAASPVSAVVFAGSLVALAVMVRLGPRFAAGDALLVGLAVSLLVNDTPLDGASARAAAYGVLWAWARVSGLAARGAVPPPPDAASGANVAAPHERADRSPLDIALAGRSDCLSSGESASSTRWASLS